MQAVENKTEIGGCDHKLYMPIARCEIIGKKAKQAMMMLKSECMLIEEWKKHPRERYCCWRASKTLQFYRNIDIVRFDYENANENDALKAYDYTIEKLKQTVNLGVQLKAERGIYND